MLTPIQQRRHLHAITLMAAEIARLAPAAHAALRNQQPGYPTNTSGGSGAPQLSESGTPPGLDRYLERNDPAAHAARQLDTTLIAAVRNLDTVRSIVATWAADIHPDAQPVLERKVSGGDCAACNRYCTGTANDRLRSGMCNACRMAWQRSGLERGEWLLGQRRELNDTDDTP